MYNTSIIAIINCAFQICFYYCLKYLAPSIKLNSNTSCDVSNTYDDKLYHLLSRLKYLVNKCDIVTDNCHGNTTYSLKVKEVISGSPSKNYELSEIYIDKSKKTFNVYTNRGFVQFPLPSKSIIKTNN